MKGVWGYLSWVCPFSWQQKPDFLATSGHTHHPPTHTRLPHVCIIDVLALCRVGPLGSARFTATLQVLKTFKAETHLTSAAPEHEHCVKSLKPDNHTKKTYSVCVCVLILNLLQLPAWCRTSAAPLLVSWSSTCSVSDGLDCIQLILTLYLWNHTSGVRTQCCSFIVCLTVAPSQVSQLALPCALMPPSRTIRSVLNFVLRVALLFRPENRASMTQNLTLWLVQQQGSDYDLGPKEGKIG